MSRSGIIIGVCNRSEMSCMNRARGQNAHLEVLTFNDWTVKSNIRFRTTRAIKKTRYIDIKIVASRTTTRFEFEAIKEKQCYSDTAVFNVVELQFSELNDGGLRKSGLVVQQTREQSRESNK